MQAQSASISVSKFFLKN